MRSEECTETSMTRRIFFYILSTTLVLAYLNVAQSEPKPKASCSVYDPFKVLPDNNKFQIGGAFPLHEPDCLTLVPDTVQDIVAIQWALTHWNQNPENDHAKMGLYAGDTCSRPKEAISQSLRFLDSVGYHEPEECLTDRKENIPKLLSIIAPKDPNSSSALGNLLKSANLVVGTYSFLAQNSFKDLENVVATVPTLEIYGDALIKLMGTLRSNLVTIIDNGDDSSITDSIVEQLRQASIFVSEVVSYDHPLIGSILKESDSKIVVSLVDKKKVANLITRDDIRGQEKIWIAITMDETPILLDENNEILKDDTKIQIISLHAKRKPLAQFKDYFLRVLKSNYESYSLLTSYVKQVFNCSVEKAPGFADCSVLDGQRMVEMYRLAHTVEPLIRLTYAFAAVGRQLTEDKQLRIANICDRPTEECTKAVIQELLKLDYEFSSNDPNEFIGEKLQFYRSGNTILLNGITLEAILTVVNENRPIAYNVLEYESGLQPKVSISNLRQQITLLRSICQPYRPYCGQCENVVDLEPEKVFLSIPKHYPLYLTGIFDFRGGSKCNVLNHNDISLPMAFIHTLWTFRQRYPQLDLLPNVDFGALLIDSCSQGRTAIQTLVQMEKQCIRFEQASRNITIVPGSIAAFVSAVGSESAETVKNYFTSGESAIPAVTIDGGNNQEKNTFTTMPSHKNLAIALLKVLKQMQWEFVSVVLSAQDFDSLAAFRVFERLANDRGVCIAEVINVQGDGHHDLMAHGSNVTLMFTTARDAASYMSGKLRHGEGYLGNTVHVMIGDAHDFYLYDRTNLANFVGTVSVQPKDVIYSDFKQWLEITTPLTLPEQWYWRFVEERWQCALSLANKNLYAGKMCTGNELLDVSALGRMTRSGYLARGLERLLFAMDAVYKRLCPEQKGVCSDFYHHGREYVQKILKNTAVEDDFEVYEFLPDHHGNFEYRPIGNWSITAGYRVITAYQTFINGAPRSDFHHTSRCLPPMCKCFLDQDFFLKPLENNQPPANEEDNSAAWSKSYVKKEPAMQYVNNDVYNSIFSNWNNGAWREDPTNYIFLALISILLLLAMAVFVLIIVKMYFRVVKGNQSLGITLLIGIILLYFTSYFFVFDPTDFVCRCRVVLHSTAYTICFGVMITKAVQLRNAEALGFNTAHHISYWNYWLLLFFIFGVQLALNVRWVAEPFMSAWTIDGLETKLICAYNKYDFLLAQAYVVILLLLALFINAQNRNIKRNYKETKWLFTASLICVLLFVMWTILYTLVPYEFRDYIVIIESLACGTILLGFVYGPKIYILLSYEPVVVEASITTMRNMSEDKDFNLFEADEELQQRPGAVSPASSTDSSTRTTRCSSLAHRCTVTSSGASSCGACSHDDDQSPMFHTVMRKKKHIRRAHSEHEYKHGYVSGTLRDNSEPTTPKSTTSSKGSHS